jgi:hypothetical protein
MILSNAADRTSRNAFVIKDMLDGCLLRICLLCFTGTNVLVTPVKNLCFIYTRFFRIFIYARHLFCSITREVKKNRLHAMLDD